MGSCLDTCILPYSLPLGETGIPSDFGNLTSNLCASGYSSAVNSPTGNVFCVNPPYNNPANIGHGVAAGTKCQVFITNADGSITLKTNVPKCGYNKDNLYYCPWALGDAPVQAIINEAKKYNIFETINKKCGSFAYSLHSCKALDELRKIPALNTFWKIFNSDPSNIDFSPFIANNAECI